MTKTNLTINYIKRKRKRKRNESDFPVVDLGHH